HVTGVQTCALPIFHCSSTDCTPQRLNRWIASCAGSHLIGGSQRRLSVPQGKRQCGVCLLVILSSSQESPLASKGCLVHLSLPIDRVKSTVDSFLETLFMATAESGSPYV